jgi:hypothetical protein
MDTEHETALASAQQELAPRLDPPAASTGIVLLLPAQRDVLRQALADAIFYRDPPVHCPTCETPDRLCSQCDAGLSLARAYLALSRELEISPAGPDDHPGGLADPAALISGDS